MVTYQMVISRQINSRENAKDQLEKWETKKVVGKSAKRWWNTYMPQIILSSIRAPF